MRRVGSLLLALVLTAPACGTRGVDPEVDPDGEFESVEIEASAAPQEPTDPQKIVDHLKAAGLPIGRVTLYNSENDPFNFAGRPDSYALKAVFHDEGVTVEGCSQAEVIPWGQCGGTVESFASAADLGKWTAAIELSREKTPNATPEYRYENGLTLLRLGHVLTPEQAGAYEAALATFAG